MDPSVELGFRLIPRVGRLPRPLWSFGFRPLTPYFPLWVIYPTHLSPMGSLQLPSSEKLICTNSHSG